MSEQARREGRPPLVPRFVGEEDPERALSQRRAWIGERTGVSLDHVGGRPLPAASLTGNVENPIGMAQVPIGLAGPLRVLGEAVDDVVYVPLATTEGALVRSYERGMVALTQAGGATVRVTRDENQVTPSFACHDLAAAVALARWLAGLPEELRAAAEATTRHGRLLAVEPRVVGRKVLACFRFSTADAHGMNMIVRATEAACHAVLESGRAESFQVFSGASAEKRAAGALLAGGKGKTAHAAAMVPAAVVRGVLGVAPEAILELWRRTAVGHFAAASIGCNGHLANGLTALFIACGQDVANVANAAVGITVFEPGDDGGLYASVTLPSLTVGTVGGGTGLGTARECLALLGCAGADRARRFAEITAATLLAGELSFAAAIAAGEMVAAHERYGRNRPAP
jgi:hydroxymethylglutaryl-CoA reductase (NADPH)